MHDLEPLKKRLRTLEAKVARVGLVLTGSQLTALEKAEADGGEEKPRSVRWAPLLANDGGFESGCQGHCGARPPGSVARVW